MTDAKKEKEKKVHYMILYFAIGARLKVMFMKGIIITFILNSNHKIQVNLLGYLYGT